MTSTWGSAFFFRWASALQRKENVVFSDKRMQLMRRRSRILAVLEENPWPDVRPGWARGGGAGGHITVGRAAALLHAGLLLLAPRQLVLEGHAGGPQAAVRGSSVPPLPSGAAAPQTATMTRLRRKALVALFLFTLFIFGTMMGLRTLKPSDGFSDLAPGLDSIGERSDRRRQEAAGDVGVSPGHFQAGGSDTKVVFSRSDRDYSIFYDVHIFYYLWYGSPSVDNKYIHWDHVLVPHWDPKIAASHAQGKHTPPEDVASSFYPELGPYSSRDPKVLESHMSQIEAAAAGTAGLGSGSSWKLWVLLHLHH